MEKKKNSEYAKFNNNNPATQTKPENPSGAYF